MIKSNLTIQEGTNKTIVINSIVLYARLIIVTLCGFFTTRFALQALGVVDYGLFSVLGGIIALVDVANSVMINTSTRFMTVALGRGNKQEINQQFNINFRIHAYTALFSLLLACTVGYWYIFKYLNYAGEIRNAILVFTFSIIAADISMIGIPYKGVITAKENFVVSSLPEVISAIIKLIISILLVHFFSHKLLIYAGAQSLLTIFPIVVCYIYSKKQFPDIVALNKVVDKTKYKEVVNFSGWTLYGTLTCLAKGQGASIVINLFFTTVMNAALGVANMLNSLISNIAQNLSQPMFPQITKSYAAGDMDRSIQLLCMTTKFSYLIILLVSAPFLIDANWIIGLWLVEVPPMTAKLTCLLIIDLLVSSFNSGVATIIKANGNIGWYEFSSNTLRLIAVIIAYFVLRDGAPVDTLFYIYIICSALIIVVNQIILKRIVRIDNIVLIKHSYIPSIIVTVLFIPILLINSIMSPILMILLGFTYLSALIWFVGFNKKERGFIKNMLSSIINRFKKK